MKKKVLINLNSLTLFTLLANKKPFNVIQNKIKKFELRSLDNKTRKVIFFCSLSRTPDNETVLFKILIFKYDFYLYIISKFDNFQKKI